MIITATVLLGAAIAGGIAAYMKGRSDVQDSFDMGQCIQEKLKKGYTIERATATCRAEYQKLQGDNGLVTSLVKYAIPMALVVGIGYAAIKMIQTAEEMELEKEKGNEKAGIEKEEPCFPTVFRR